MKRYPNKDLKVVQAPPRPTPDGFPFKKHFLAVVAGSRGMGKTNSLINLVLHAEAIGFWDKVYLFSPTMKNDPKNDLLRNRSFEFHAYDYYSDALFKEVDASIRDDIAEYKRYEVEKKVYDKWMKHGAKGMDPDELRILDSMLFDDETIREPVSRFKAMPTTLLIMDDLVSNTQLYRPQCRGPFYAFAIAHRHFCTSIIFSVQTWKGAVPRGLRANLSLLMLFRAKRSIMKLVSDEVCTTMEEDDFYRLWDDACKEPHDLLMVDFDQPEWKGRYRRNFDEIYTSVPGSSHPLSLPKEEGLRKPLQACEAGAGPGRRPEALQDHH